MVTIRQFRADDAPSVWALSTVPNIGATADPMAPIPLVPADSPPSNFPDLGDIHASFRNAGGEFLVATLGSHVVAMGGIRPNNRRQVEVLRVRVHPATRRRGIGRALMTALEESASELGFQELHLDTATNQPESVAFYRSIGYQEIGRVQPPGATWTLVYFTKPL